MRGQVLFVSCIVLWFWYIDCGLWFHGIKTDRLLGYNIGMGIVLAFALVDFLLAHARERRKRGQQNPDRQRQDHEDVS